MKKTFLSLFGLTLFGLSCSHFVTDSSEKFVENFAHRNSQIRAVANGTERGGGDALYCPKGPFGKKYYFADTYELFNSDKKELFDKIERLVPKEHHRVFVLELIALGMDPQNRDQFLKMAFSLISNFKVEEVDDVEEIDDDNIELPSTCEKKVQLAVNEIRNFKIRVKKDVYNSLTSIEREFLIIHEIFIYTYYVMNINIWDPSWKIADSTKAEVPKFDTTQIRNFLKNLAEGQQFAKWFEGFKTFVSIPGLRIFSLLLDVKFLKYRDPKKDYKIYAGHDLEIEDVVAFSKRMQYKLINTKSIWLQDETKDMERGWRQIYSAVINDEKNVNIGIIEISCQRPLSSLDFDSLPRSGRRSTITARPPIEYEKCYIEKLL